MKFLMMKSLMLLAVVLFLPFSAFSQTRSTLLKDLPDGAKIRVLKSFSLMSTDYNDVKIHSCSFTQNKHDRTGSASTWVIDYFKTTKVAVQTRSLTALEKGDDGYQYVEAADYCLEKNNSNFSDENQAVMFFSNCNGDASVLVIYAIAGNRLDDVAGFKGYTVQNFHDEAGSFIQFLNIK